MKNLKKIFLAALVFSVFAACSTQPDLIAYGHDSCHYCKMTIVSEAFSAQAVSKKGKQHKYDAIECMVNDMLQNETETAILQVANFSKPGTMIAAEKASFVINDSINSPMGANLAAIGSETYSAENILSWEELKAHFARKTAVTSSN